MENLKIKTLTPKSIERGYFKQTRTKAILQKIEYISGMSAIDCPSIAITLKLKHENNKLQ